MFISFKFSFHFLLSFLLNFTNMMFMMRCYHSIKTPKRDDQTTNNFQYKLSIHNITFFSSPFMLVCTHSLSLVQFYLRYYLRLLFVSFFFLFFTTDLTFLRWKLFVFFFQNRKPVLTRDEFWKKYFKEVHFSSDLF